jgi:hypothetical protein
MSVLSNYEDGLIVFRLVDRESFVKNNVDIFGGGLLLKVSGLEDFSVPLESTEFIIRDGPIFRCLGDFKGGDAKPPGGGVGVCL